MEGSGVIKKVAFIGRMFSGKTTASNILVQDMGFVKLAFADPVKIVSAAMLDQMNAYLRVYDLPALNSNGAWDYDTIQKRKKEPQVRKLLQLVGTELGRELVGYENIWVDILLKSAEDLECVVVDDCRFPNEADALREHGFRIVRVDRPVEDRLTLMRKAYPHDLESIMDHPSETSLDLYEHDDYLFAEDLDKLQETVLHYVRSSDH